MTNRPSDNAPDPGAGSRAPAGPPHAGAAPDRAVAQMSEPRRRPQRSRQVAEAVWDWKPRRSAPAERSGRPIRWTAFRDAAIGLGVAAALYLAGRPGIAYVAAGIAAFVLALAILLPAAWHARVSGVARRTAHGAGNAISIAALAVVYFSVFLMLRAWRTLSGNDSLRLRARPEALSYWIDRSTLPETKADRPY